VQYQFLCLLGIYLTDEVHYKRNYRNGNFGYTKYFYIDTIYSTRSKLICNKHTICSCTFPTRCITNVITVTVILGTHNVFLYWYNIFYTVQTNSSVISTWFARVLSLWIVHLDSLRSMQDFGFMREKQRCTSLYFWWRSPTLQAFQTLRAAVSPWT